MRYFICLFTFFFLSSPLFALAVKPNAPERYVVQPGDTLIEIAERYLVNPSDWPALLSQSYTKNPYQLYPGEVLSLNRTPQPSLKANVGGTIKLSPQIRSQPLNRPIPIIPLSPIKPFLNSALVVNATQLKIVPYVVGHEGHHLNSGVGDMIYVMNLKAIPESEHYAIFREGSAYRDPVTRQVLGYKAIHVGYVHCTIRDNPATCLITEANREVDTGDRLLPAPSAQISQDFFPSNPPIGIEGQIIDVLDGMTQVGPNYVVILNLGSANGVKPGNIFKITQTGQMVKDPQTRQQVRLPSATAGQLMVFRVFNQLSYALVLVAYEPIHAQDRVTALGE